MTAAVSEENDVAGVCGAIDGRADFFGVLDRAIAEGKAFQAKYVGDATIHAIVAQLESVKRLERERAYAHRGRTRIHRHCSQSGTRVGGRCRNLPVDAFAVLTGSVH